MFKNANFFITDFFRSLIGKPPAENVTPKIANAIQKQDYFNSIKDIHHSNTPPYVLISYQLLNDKAEIFQAAVYYLCSIAQNSPNLKNEIMNVLQTYCNENKKLVDRVNFVQDYMKKINL